jgi:hypothetical protein
VHDSSIIRRSHGYKEGYIRKTAFAEGWSPSVCQSARSRKNNRDGRSRPLQFHRSS